MIILPKLSNEQLQLEIPVIAPAIVWLGVVGNLQLALRHPQNVGASRPMIENFARDLLNKLMIENILTPDEVARVFRDFQGG